MENLRKARTAARQRVTRTSNKIGDLLASEESTAVSIEDACGQFDARLGELDIIQQQIGAMLVRRNTRRSTVSRVFP